MSTFDYESYPGSYQYEALYSRNPVQRFWHRKKLEFVKTKLGPIYNQRVLDVGCGSGVLCLALADHCKEVVGVDISRKAVEFAKYLKRKQNSANVTFVKIEETSLPFPSESFDAVIMTELIEHLKTPTALFLEASRVLKRGGRLFITTPNYRSGWPLLEWFLDYFQLTPPLNGHQHISKFTFTSLRKFLEPQLTIDDQGSLYWLSPFLSFCWPVAQKIFVLENRLHLPFGLLLYALGHKR